jgi:hypothetical protein
VKENKGSNTNSKQHQAAQHGHGLSDGWFAHRKKNDERQKQIEVLLDAKGPNVREGLVDSIIDKEILSKGE